MTNPHLCDRLAELGRAAGLSEPEMITDELYLLLEGARHAQSVAPKALVPRLIRKRAAMIAAHRRQVCES